MCFFGIKKKNVNLLLILIVIESCSLPGRRIIENIQFPRVSLGTIPKLILGNFVPMNRSGNSIPKDKLGNLGSILLKQQL